MTTAPSLQSARLYGILDTGYVETSTEAWENACLGLLAGGVDVLQLRAKGASTAERRSLLERILPCCTAAGIPLVLNDDLDLARAVPGVGLHLGQEDVPVEEARAALGPDRLLGLSTHSPSQAEGAIARSGLLDYFAVGPVFATPTKPTYTPVGLELVAEVSAMRPPLPWFCIGGLKLDRWPRVAAVGGRRAVVVSEWLQAPDIAAQVRRWRAAMA
jgi:thiamine-phosphate pyrophosphorylase